jgi:GTP pyrophosphokinase
VKTRKRLTPDELRDRLLRFYARYGVELDQIRDLLQIQLRQLALTYTLNNKLPREAVTVSARVKSYDSLLTKLRLRNWPQFYYPTDFAQDLIGARVVCWFVDDCYGMLDFLKSSSHFKVHNQRDLKIRDYIKQPQFVGYRALHVFADIIYDAVQRETGQKAEVEPQSIICEIQVRTKLQDAWADVTHEFFYKAKTQGVKSAEHEFLLADLAERLSVEDKSFMKFRNFYQKLADSKSARKVRRGFAVENPKS